MHRTPCDRAPLAAGDFAQVEICGCGSVHVTIGAITLRLRPDALPELARVLGDAARELTLQEALAAHRHLSTGALS